MNRLAALLLFSCLALPAYATDIAMPGSTSGSTTFGPNPIAGSTTFRTPGTNGSNTNILQTDGSGNTSWVAGGAGTVTSVTCGTGLSGGAITGSGTCTLNLGNANIWTALQTFAAVNGGINVQSGTTYTTVAADCGKTLLMTGTSPVVTIAASIAPASGTSCVIGVIQGGSTKVSVNGSAVSAAALVSAHSYTGTNGTIGATVDIILTTVSATATAYLTGDGS